MMELGILLNALKRKEFAFPIAFLLFFLIFGIIMLINDLANSPGSIEEAKKSGCVLEYGKWRCIDGKVAVPFYNSGTLDITSVRLKVPMRSGLNIYEASGVLKIGDAGTLVTAICQEAMMENASVEWCCLSQCFNQELKNPSTMVFVEVKSH